MKVVAAYLLSVLGGNKSPTADDIRAILASVGVEAEDDKIELLLSETKDKDLSELIACGKEKMALSFPVNGGFAASVFGVEAPNDVSADSVDVTEKKNKEEKEMVEESDEDMCFNLFD